MKRITIYSISLLLISTIASTINASQVYIDSSVDFEIGNFLFHFKVNKEATRIEIATNYLLIDDNNITFVSNIQYPNKIAANTTFCITFDVYSLSNCMNTVYLNLTKEGNLERSYLCTSYTQNGKIKHYSQPVSLSEKGIYSLEISATVENSEFFYSGYTTEDDAINVIIPPQVQTNPATNVEDESATLEGTLLDNGGETCQAWFEYYSYCNGEQKEHKYTEKQNITTGSFNEIISTMAGYLYKYRAIANNTAGTDYGYWVEFLTYPYPPTDFEAEQTSATTIFLSWSKYLSTDRVVIVRKEGSYPSSLEDGTLIYNSTGSTFTDSGLELGKIYYYSAWGYAEENGESGTFYKYSLSPAHAWNHTLFTPPYDIQIEKINESYINISWSKGAGADTTIIVKKSGGYPSSLNDGTLIYNDTGNYTVVEFSYGDYFSMWSYNSTLDIYSEKLDVEFGGVRIYCYNESNIEQNLTFDISITSLSGEEVFYKENCTSPELITSADIPMNATQVAISISSEGYRNRVFYLNLQTQWTTIYTYLPPENVAQLYYIAITDRYDAAVPDAYITVQKIINDTYVSISILKTRGDGSTDVYLIPGDTYRLKIEKGGYQTRYESLIPSETQYAYIFKIYSIGALPSIGAEEIGKNVTLLVTSSPKTISISYNDQAEKTEWANFSIYLLNNGSFILIDFANITINNYQKTFENLDSGLYKVLCKIKREWYFENLTGENFYATKILTFTKIVYVPEVQRNWIEELFRNVFGESPLGWIPLIIFVFALFIFFSFSPAYSHVGIIATGMIMIFFNLIIGFTLASMGVASFLILIGFLLAYKNAKQRGEIP